MRPLMVLPLLFVISGCGDLLGKKVVKRKLQSSQFSVDCKLDVNEFSDILHRNIEPQIRCLQENLNLFIRVVKTDKPGYLSRQKLEAYIRNDRPDIKPEMLKALKSVFEINHLITGDNPEYVSKESVDNLIEFAVTFNKQAALNFGPIFQNDQPATYALHLNHRDRVEKASIAILISLRNIFNADRKGEIHKLNIIKLLESFSTEDTAEGIEKAKKFLFGKKLILGGKKDEITHKELDILIQNLDRLLVIGLDAIRYKHILLEQSSMLDFLRNDVNIFKDIISHAGLGNRDEETLFFMDEAFDAIKVVVDKEDFDIDKFRDIILEGKKIAMGGNSSDVKGREVKTLISRAQEVLETGLVFHRFYDKFRAQMESPQAVTINFNDYMHTFPEHTTQLKQFERIVKKYRFLKGSFLSAYYTDLSQFPFMGKGAAYKRNADAIVEVALFEYVLKLVFQTYGSPSPNSDAVGGFSIDKDQMRNILLKFEDVLIEIGLILPQRAIQTADNISLLGSLFQYQSDKNKVMDINEATEFATSLITSIDMSKEIFKYIEKKNCESETFVNPNNPKDKMVRIEPNCFKEHFWQAYCTNYRVYYPMLFTALGAPKSCEDLVNTDFSQNFLDKSVRAARTCNFYTDGAQEEIWYSEGDIMTILLVIIHSETTVLRWDTNGNNTMDADEVNNAYEIYSPALDGFLEEKPAFLRWPWVKKIIFQYLVKYEEIPGTENFKSIMKFIKFAASFKKKAPADRKTIASILTAIGDENQKLAEGPQFNCNWLRDPYNIPREIDMDNVRVPVPNKPLPQLTSLKAKMTTYSAQQKEVILERIGELADDMIAGRVGSINEIADSELRTLYRSISKDQRLMSDINYAIEEGSDVERISFALTMILTEQ